MTLLTTLHAYTPPSSAPVISGLNSGTNALASGQSCTISGLQFTTTPGTITLLQGALSQVQSSGVSWADTSISFTANTSIFAYGAIVLEVTNANGTAQANVTLVPAAGKGYVTVDVPWPSTAYSVLSGASPAAEDGDQLEYETTTNNAGTVSMFADGTFSIDDGTQGHTFHVRVFDQTDKTWSTSTLITINASAVITIVDPVDGDGTVIVGQVGAIILGSGFGGSTGSVTIGGVAQTVTAWTNTSITINVNASTPIGTQLVTVNTATTYGSVSCTVAAFAGSSPAFLGPAISIAGLSQNVAMAPVGVAARFQDPTGQALTFYAIGSWPAGLSVTAASGVIQGTPSSPGTYGGLSVRATDPDGHFIDSNTFTVSVAAAVSSSPTFIGPAISLSAIVQGSAMTPVPLANRFQHPASLAMTFAARGTWPAGVTLTVAGTVQGTPTTAGTYSSLSIRATDSSGNFVDSNAFSIVVSAAAGGGGGGTTPTPTTPPTGGDVNDVSIANRALTKLGANRIISFGDDTKEGRAIAACYYFLRDAELRRRKWRFSLKRAQLPALTETPAFGYAYAYQLPSDCLSILTVGDVAPGVDLSDYRLSIDTALYSLEGRTILTDLPAPLNLRYKARISDPTQFDVAFVEALAARIAWELAEDLTQSSQKKVDAQTEYKVAIREAVAANALETTPDIIPDSSWLLSRA